MGVVIVAGDIPREAYRTLTYVIVHEDGLTADDLQVVKFSPEHQFEGGPSESKLTAMLHKRLGTTPLPVDHPDFDDLEIELANELAMLKTEVWDEAWKHIEGDAGEILAIIYDVNFRNGRSWTWLDNGQIVAKNVPYYVFYRTRHGTGRLELQDGNSSMYGDVLHTPARRRSPSLPPTQR